ncbi:malonate decarboxylase holo-ACP synthase [Pseudomonas mediterranea]|uniref:Phosphoribosyl-dephospho-CoA transferase n=1 Tax=Pseudomonas mediterranea TaxID=183795 RepID=A0AAX2D9B6_9PSED|nr:malonate decarboxylase holo-ACP synthase [Pseudomonas mediterranea]KGU83677.1 phosphoribosyl-dephospho-CoA transferase [Pseudomonas mediterranea CFBP 5447]MBL0842568.1 malonate decarboxylase holo-ACP synthase [Pseudomonas mediterranea]MDU9029035.1 malonate decarboxylase holo-ACP synthase [Pseudomonas mediterranea]UZE00680.1 malonate decarboxylase holo-ACP synthase [Pseudomonas mediterranea]CAH0290074.1 Phosphoribosyl-dephospho-CoA transferase [Pseudomonas mediterranea]
MVSTFLAHDLLWGMTPQYLTLDAPAWAVQALGLGQPVVVRRALTAPGQVAVGVRGRTREQRYAALMPRSAIQRRVRPEDLCHIDCQRDLPALQVLSRLRPMLDACGWTWGISGSAGFELASGIEALHECSDLDLILRTPQLMDRNQARDLLAQLDGSVCAVDMQLQTPFGAVALREWAGSSRRVLLKDDIQARLVSNPWQSSLEQVA